MLKLRLSLILCTILTMMGANAQVTTEPAIIQEDSENVVVYYHADQGNKDLANLPATTVVYAHTGVLTGKSSGNNDWKYAPKWLDNSEKYKCEYVSPNLYKLTIGNIRTYYGITDPAETIRKLCFVFRNADGSKQGKTTSNGDIFVDVKDAGLQISLETNLEGNVITPSTAKVQFRLGATQAGKISLSINGVEVAAKDNTTLFETEYTFTEAGSYTCTGTVTTATATASTRLTLAYTGQSPSKPFPGGGKPVMGTTRNTDGTVTFCLAAPGKTSVVLVGSWLDYAVTNDMLMNYTDFEGQRYFWTTVSGLDADKEYLYYYLVDSSLAIGDPYARLVLDPTNDRYIPSSVYPDLPLYPSDKVSDVPLAIYRENINDYDWKVKSFKPAANSDLIIYELLLRDFTGTEGKSEGNGTVRKAIEKFDYIKSLNVNVVELLPINEFNGNNSWGYNPNFYFAPDKAYGTPDDYKEFIDLCHSNGIAVVLDMVFNQSDWMHPWYRMYAVGTSPFYNATAPHAYSVLNDWNQGHPLVRQQWKDVVQYWMKEYKVDGFRFDLVKGLGDNDSYQNSSDAATNAYNASRVANMRDIQLAMLEVNPDCIFINENLAQAREENEMGAFGQLNWANYNEPGGQYAMGYQSSSGLNGMYAPESGRTWGTTVSYLESHDEERLAYKQNEFGIAGVKGNRAVSMKRLGSAAAQMILTPGAHMIWQFSEMGNAQSTKDANGGNNTSPKKVDWNLLNNVNNYGLVDNYRELIRIRRVNPDLFTEAASYTGTLTQSNWANGRTMVSSNGSKQLITVINPNVDKSISVYITFADSNQDAYYIASKSYASEPSFDAASGLVTVPANCYVCIATNNVSEVKEINNGESSLRAYGMKGEILIEGGLPADIYSINGSCVYSGNGTRVSLPAGIYVVRAAGETMKVMVR